MKIQLSSLALLSFISINAIVNSQPVIVSLNTKSLSQAKELAPLLNRLRELKEQNNKVDEFYAQKGSNLSNELEWLEAKEPNKQAITQIRAELCEKIVPTLQEQIKKDGITHILFSQPGRAIIIIDVANIDWSTLFDISPGQVGKYHVWDISGSIVESLNKNNAKAETTI